MTGPPPAAAPTGGVWSVPGMVALAVLALTGFSGYAVLLPSAPLWVVEGGSDPGGAGLVNFVLLGSTVATQFAVPALIRRVGWAAALSLGLVLLGAPSLAFGLSSDLGPVLALSAVRGSGFGILTVAASAAAVLLVEPGRRGAAVGAYSLALSLPNVVLMPVGGWVAAQWGFWPVFVIGALPLLGVPAAHALGRHLPDRATADPVPHPVAAATTARTGVAGQDQAVPGLLRAVLPATVVLLAVTLAGGAVITFAPQVVDAGWLSAAGLLALGLSSTVVRWRVGGLADRVGPARLVWPFVLVATVGVGWIAWLVREPLTPAAVVPWVLACAVTGVAYGGLQNLTMLRAFEAAGPGRVGAASAVWNAGFDAGTAVGALLVGWIATGAGFGPGFAVAAVLCLLTLPVALRDRR
ncbi:MULTISPECIES: MFS transporter [unclassified Ornithinimicrobium]|uniref:MFS transporter n=1 Tax=unclassified Ornithinimicrobium TaxID=2615080 RepID=UPI0038544C43